MNRPIVINLHVNQNQSRRRKTTLQYKDISFCNSLIQPQIFLNVNLCKPKTKENQIKQSPNPRRPVSQTISTKRQIDSNVKKLQKMFSAERTLGDTTQGLRDKFAKTCELPISPKTVRQRPMSDNNRFRTEFRAPSGFQDVINFQTKMESNFTTKYMTPVKNNLDENVYEDSLGCSLLAKNLYKITTSLPTAQTIEASQRPSESKDKKTYTYEELRQLISNKPNKQISSTAVKVIPKVATEAISKNKQIMQFMAQNEKIKNQIMAGTRESRISNKQTKSPLPIKKPQRNTASTHKVIQKPPHVVTMSEYSDPTPSQSEPVTLVVPPTVPQQKVFVYKDPQVTIGKGKYGPVDLIIVDNQLMALKRIKKEMLDQPKRIEHIKTEKKILKYLNSKDNEVESKFIVKLQQTFTDRDYVCLAFEYIKGQDLYSMLTTELQMVGAQRREFVIFYLAEIIVALQWLHSHNIIYRDLKPDNVMIDNDGHIKLIDFGFAKHLSQNEQFRTMTNCGTIGYAAPEVIQTNMGYSFQADVWSLGILICELMTGSLPFEEKGIEEIHSAILRGDIRYQSSAIDQTTRDLLSQIFVMEPNLRITLENIKKHRLFWQPEGHDKFWKAIQTKTYKNGMGPLIPKDPASNKLPADFSELEETSNMHQQAYSHTALPRPQDMESPLLPQSPSKKKKFNNNFVVQRVNKEFENF